MNLVFQINQFREQFFCVYLLQMLQTHKKKQSQSNETAPRSNTDTYPTIKLVRILYIWYSWIIANYQ